jgi:GNAT superfamily N-acetyltransferase
MSLRIVPVTPDTVEDWRAIHNEIIPTSPLSPEEVTQRLSVHRLTLAYVGDTLVGNATVRPPAGDALTATVIVRIRPPHRRQGYGSDYLRAAIADARALGARRIETVVLASNESGLAFATSRGFVEFDRYTLDGDSIPFIDLYLV